MVARRLVLLYFYRLGAEYGGDGVSAGDSSMRCMLTYADAC